MFHSPSSTVVHWKLPKFDTKVLVQGDIGVWPASLAAGSAEFDFLHASYKTDCRLLQLYKMTEVIRLYLIKKCSNTIIAPKLAM